MLSLPGARAGAVLACLLIAGAGTACGRPASPFSLANARAHVNRLAGDIGPRPAGSDANRRAREYLVEQLRFYGFSVRVQEADAVRHELGLTARVQNIIAILPGSLPDAIALVAHYDSAPRAPGAGDDAAGVAICLEAGRVLAARKGPRHSLMVLLTDAEEKGLMGAAALVTDPEVQARLRAYVNFDSAGNALPVMLFQTGPGSGWLLRAFAAAAPRPRGNSSAYEVYSRLPNDTDFSVLRTTGAPGLNLGAIGDSYPYHTPQDAAERLTDDVLAEGGANVLRTVQALDDRNLSTRTDEQPIYFDVLSTHVVVLSPLAGQVLGITALALGLAGWIRALMVAWRTAGPAGSLRTVAWVNVGAIAIIASVVGAAALLRAVREVYHPWYAHPGRFWLMLALAGIVALHAILAVHARLPAWLRGVRDPALTWALALPPWMGLAALMQWAAPAAAFLWTVPLACAGLAALVTVRPGALAWLAAAAAFTVTAVLWIPEAHAFLQFAVPLLGRLGIVAPVGALPAALLAAAFMLAVPACAVASATRQGGVDRSLRGRRLAVTGTVVTVALVLAFGWAYVAPAYTHDRPLWRYAQYQADYGAGRAAWEVASIEPGLDVRPHGAPSGWRLASGPLLSGSPLGGLMLPYAFRTSVVPGAPPLTAQGTITPSAEGVDVQVRLALTEPGATVFVALPGGLVPVRASLAGRIRDTVWTAAYAAAPPGTVVFSASFRAADAPRLAGIRAGLRTDTLPGATDATGLPAWLPVEHAAWETRAVHLVPVSWVAQEATLR